MKIAVLVSGGVDSSVALTLLKEAGYDVTAFYLKIWLEDELSFLGECPWDEDLDFVKAICTKLDIQLEIVSMQKEYFENVVNYTINEVKNGRTPNPDVMCNNHIKFGLFFEKIDTAYSKIATGHYAQVEEINGRWFLKQSPDPVKDQTYFLANLSQEQLSRAMFPIGHMKKEQVRELAFKHDLPNKDRKDSQGICFLGKLKFNDFLKHYLGEQKGDIIEFETGEKLGEHEGFWYYTIGQRRNIKLGGGPWFVVSKDVKNNIIYISNHYFENKNRNEFNVDNCNWFAGHAPDSQNLTVKLRHGEKKYNCVLSGNNVKIDGNDQGIAAGQFAVFYSGDLCLGSAVIVN